jgi:chromosome segregation ATPase
VSLNSLSRAVDDLNAHTKRLEAAKARRADLRLELDAVNGAIEAAQSAIETTEKLVKELASKVGQ